MKILIIGNSHVGALLNAFHEIGSAEGLSADIDFVGRPQGKGGVNEIEVLAEERAIVISGTQFMRTCGQRVNLDDYSTFVLVGLNSQNVPLARLYSSQVIEQWVVDLQMAENQFLKLAAQIAAVGKDVKVVFAPLPTERMPGRMLSVGVREFLESLDILNDALCSKKVEFVFQPIETVDEDLKLSKACYAGRNSGHLNSDFGKVMLQKLLRTMPSSSVESTPVS